MFIGILIRVLSHLYFAQHICSNMEKFVLPRMEDGGWSYFSYSHYVAMRGDNRIRKQQQQQQNQHFKLVMLNQMIFPGKEDNPCLC